MWDNIESPVNNSLEAQSPQCQFFVVRKKRLCRMTVRPGRDYCGEHEPLPRVEAGPNDTRIPCPNDPKHTCYASKLQKHLSICNARLSERPAYIVPGVNASSLAPAPRRALSQVPRDKLHRLIEKVNKLYDEYVKDEISEVTERPIHAAVSSEYAAAGRAEGSRRHLRQVSSLLRLAEDAGLVRERTCYVELGAGKGHLSYYAWRAWCEGAGGRGSRVLLVDRASLRHKRDNKLRRLAAEAHDQGTYATEELLDESVSTKSLPERDAPSTRLRADLAHLALHAVPVVRESAGVVGLAKHLCGAATDYALRCVTAAGVRARGLVLAGCCHHRCDHSYFGRDQLEELGIDDEDLEIMFGVVSWGTCGDGRPRSHRLEGGEDKQPDVEERSATGRRAKALLEWGRARRLGALGFRARLVRYVPRRDSPENLAILATRLDPEDPEDPEDPDT